MFRNPVVTLILIVAGAIWYSIYGGHFFLARKPARIDSRCYNVDVPKEIKYKDAELFCSCVHAGGHVSKEENYKYCVNKFVE